MGTSDERAVALPPASPTVVRAGAADNDKTHGAAPTLGHLDQVDPRAIWRHEARDFTPWLLANANRLGEALGLDLELTTAEHAVGGFALDLIGRDLATGQVVIIENQLADSNHTHLGQLLTYAAGTAAATIIWITTRLREEHRQALIWLNQQTSEDTHFFGVELQVVRIGDSAPAPLFKIVAEPNDWQKAVKRSADETASGRGGLYAQFWDRYLARVRRKHAGWRTGRPLSQSWMWMTAPIKSCGLSPAFTSGGRIRHELYVDAATPELSFARFEFLLAQKDVLEQAYGRPLTWEPLPDKRACRIAEYRDGDIARVAEHDAYMDFFLDAGERMRAALKAVQLPD
jgi:hypothetical protein